MTYLIVNVYLIGHKYGRDAFGMLLQLVVPVFQVLVSYLASDIKHHDAGMGSIVVRCVHTVEPLLPCCIPDVCMSIWIQGSLWSQSGGADIVAN